MILVSVCRRWTSGSLRNYVLFLANTGIRHGTEALGLTWRNIEWYLRDGERYLAVSVDGKTNKRTAIARDRVVDFLWRQAQINPRIVAADFDGLISSKLDAPVFTTRLSATVTVHNLNRAFNALLDELDLKTGADGRTRTLYSWRHFYATQDLERGVSTHALSRQLGNSTEMIEALQQVQSVAECWVAQWTEAEKLKKLILFKTARLYAV